MAMPQEVGVANEQEQDIEAKQQTTQIWET